MQEEIQHESKIDSNFCLKFAFTFNASCSLAYFSLAAFSMYVNDYPRAYVCSGASIVSTSVAAYSLYSYWRLRKEEMAGTTVDEVTHLVVDKVDADRTMFVNSKFILN